MIYLASKRERLLSELAGYGSCAVAFSGGVDSAVVAKAAHMALGDKAVAVTGVGEALAAGELDEAREIARLIGIRHLERATEELARPGYVENSPTRCYHCKTELYTHLEQVAGELGLAVIVNGANMDDLGDYRPGMQAAREHLVRSPLAECGFTKQDVRDLAAEWQLPVWDKPATPCLASRIAYGQQVTPERLRMIDAAEQHLRTLGLREVRVRYHEGDLARVEVPVSAISKIADDATREALVARLHQLGFKFVTLDLAGFRSGSLNTLVPLESLLNARA
ncbi:MAG: ATP-dependent sacrificial sulfur transferase LarE [Pirellulales bacterium]